MSRTGARLLGAACLPLLFVVTEARGGTRAAVAVFPVVRTGAPRTEIVDRLEAVLGWALESAAVNAVKGAALERRVPAAAEAMRRCSGDLACVARLGRRARALHVLFARSEPAAAGVKLTFLLVASGKARVERKASLTIASAAAVEGALGGVFEQLFRVTPPPQLQGGAALAAEYEALPEIPLAPVLAVLPPAAAPGDDIDLAPLPVPELTPVLPGAPASATTDGTAAARAAAGTPPGIEVINAKSAETAAARPEAPVSQPAEAPAPVQTYVGISIAALGVAALACGGFFGVQSKNAYDEADESATQVRAGELAARGDAAVTRANVLFAVGGVLAAAGGTLVGLELAGMNLFGGDAPTPTVSVSSDGVQGQLLLRW